MSWDLTRARGTLVLRGGYGVFYDSGTLIENSALYFNPPYFGAPALLPAARAAHAREPVPGDGRIAGALDQHARPRLPHGLRAAGEPRPRALVASTTLDRALRRRLRRQPRAQAQPQSGPARRRADRGAPPDPRASATSSSSSPRRSSELSRAAAARSSGGTRRRPLVPRRLHLVEVHRRHVGVPRHRRRRQHAAGQPQPRRRVEPVRLRRPPSAGRVGHVGPAGTRGSAPSRATGR